MASVAFVLAVVGVVYIIQFFSNMVTAIWQERKERQKRKDLAKKRIELKKGV